MQSMASYQRRIILTLAIVMLGGLMLKLIDRQRRAVNFDIEGFLDGYKFTVEVDTSRAEVTASTNVLKLPKKEMAGAGADSSMAAKVKLNEADFVELQRLPGVGPVLAKRIVAYRDSVGHFGKADDLLKVKGIGEKKLAQMKEYLEL